jgi:hypothetical protein
MGEIREVMSFFCRVTAIYIAAHKARKHETMTPSPLHPFTSARDPGADPGLTAADSTTVWHITAADDIHKCVFIEAYSDGRLMHCHVTVLARFASTTTQVTQERDLCYVATCLGSLVDERVDDLAMRKLLTGHYVANFHAPFRAFPLES